MKKLNNSKIKIRETFKISNLKQNIWKLEKNLMYYLPKSLGRKWYYYSRTRKKLNLSNPKDFNEKIQWLIVNKYGKNESVYADKILVRDFVDSKGYNYILPKIYGVYDHVDQIDFTALPEKFVIKTNHGSGERFYEVCTDKSALNVSSIKRKFSRALKENYAKHSLEYHYKYISPKVYIEEFIESNSDDLKDYKVFCFNGKPRIILVTSNRTSDLKRDYYDTEWNQLDLVKKQYMSNTVYEKPIILDEMLIIAENLARDFIFVRVDFYYENGKIYFGELTLTPATGINMTYNKSALTMLGSLLKIP